VSTSHQLDGATWRFMTWNLDWWRRHDQRVPRTALLTEQAATVVALQEVSGEVAKTLRAHHPGEALFSQELHPGANWRWMGCGLLLPPQATVLDRGVVRSLPKPQRGIYAVVQLPGQQPMTFVSWHTPNAAGDGREVKMRAYAAMTKWLAAATTPAVLGAHAGQPLQRGDRSILRLPAPPAASTAAPELRQARKVLQRPRVDLDAVAGVYTEAQQQGRRDPTIAVAEHIGKARSTAASYVSKARVAGLLPPPQR